MIFLYFLQKGIDICIYMCYYNIRKEVNRVDDLKDIFKAVVAGVLIILIERVGKALTHKDE